MCELETGIQLLLAIFHINDKSKQEKWIAAYSQLY